MEVLRIWENFGTPEREGAPYRTEEKSCSTTDKMVPSKMVSRIGYGRGTLDTR